MNKQFRAVALASAVVFSTDNLATAKEVIYALFGNGRIEKYDTDGTPIGGFKASSTVIPFSLAVDIQGNTYMASLYPSKVLRFDPSGAFVDELPLPNRFASDNTFPQHNGSAIGPDGNYYLGVNSGTDRIERYAPDGTSLGVFAITQYDGVGAPLSLAFDASGNLFVNTSQEISSFDTSGAPLGVFAASKKPSSDIAFDGIGNLYRSDSSSITVLSPSGDELRTITHGFTAHALAFDTNDIMYVGGHDNTKEIHAVIKKFLADGTPLGTIVQVPALPGHVAEIIDVVIVNQNPEPTTLTMLFVGFLGMTSHRLNRVSRIQFDIHNSSSDQHRRSASARC
jgi:hypothetical protein